MSFTLSLKYGLGIFTIFKCDSSFSQLIQLSLAFSGRISSHLIFCFQNCCIIIFTFTVTGSTKRRGSNNLYDKLSTDLLMTFLTFLISSLNFAKELDRVSASAFQLGLKF